MKKIIVCVLALLLPLASFGYNELDTTLQKFYQKNKVVVKPNVVNDYTLTRRTYLDLAGRIPTLDH